MKEVLFVVLLAMYSSFLQAQENIDSVRSYILPLYSSYYIGITPDILINNKIESKQCLLTDKKQLKRFGKNLKKARVVNHYPSRNVSYYDIRILYLIYKGEEVEQLLIDYTECMFYNQFTYTYDKGYFLDKFPNYCE